jgi:predicted O-methyltransferase YrrM
MSDSTLPSYPFDRAWSFAAQAKGWLGRPEAELLYRLAAAVGARGRVVELGSYCGRSSIVLAAGVQTGSSGTLVCVDTFRGSPEHRPGQPHFDPETLIDGIVDTYPAFVRNMEKAGLLERIEVMRLPAVEAAAGFSAPIALLFIDADHKYEAVREQLRAWSPRVVQDGVIVFHDIGAFSGPTRAAADLLDAGFERHAQAGTALALSRPVPRR